MSKTYRAVVGGYFPHARLVADRFHVVRLVMYHFLELFRALDPTMKHQRGTLAVLRKRPDRLIQKQRKRRDEFFGRFPIFLTICEQMQKLCALMREKTKSKRQCGVLVTRLRGLIDQLRESKLGRTITLARALTSWQEEIACMWRYSKKTKSSKDETDPATSTMLSKLQQLPTSSHRSSAADQFTPILQTFPPQTLV